MAYFTLVLDDQPAKPEKQVDDFLMIQAGGVLQVLCNFLEQFATSI